MRPDIVHDPRLKEILTEAAKHYRLRDDQTVIKLLREAVERVPQRLDIRQSLANYHVQTGHPERALVVLRELLKIAPADIRTRVFLAHWSRYCGDMDGAEEIRRRIGQIRPPVGADLGQIWRHIDAWKSSPIGDSLPVHTKDGKNTAIVVLGYVLNQDGSMRTELVRRLEKGLEAARAYPDAGIVVTGGVPQSGVVEAAAMHLWLIEHAVPPERIFIEGYARDVVENLIYSRQILEIIRADSILLITSANNVRRTGAAMEILSWTNGSSWQIDVVAATLTGFTDNGGDKLKLYRDALRAYGCPMMVAFPELVER